VRIAWLISLYPPYIVGGNEMLARDVVQALLARGHDVHVLTAQGRELDTTPYIHQVLNYHLEDKDAIFLGGRALTPASIAKHHIFDFRTYRTVRSTVRQLQPDLIVVDNQYMASAAPLLAVRGTHCPIIAQVADKWLRYLLWDLSLLLRPSRRRQQQVLQMYVRWVQPLLQHRGKPDAIVAISDFIKGQYVKAGFPLDRITVAYLGVDTALFQPRQKPHAHDNSLEVVFAGQLWEGKGPQVLVDALGRLRQREPDLELRLRIIGEGTEAFKQYLRAEIQKHGMEDRTVLDGFVPLPVLAERLRNADIFAFPSIWDEPFSITLVAAMASGASVVAAKTGGTPEAFVDGVEGILVPPQDADALAGAVLRLARNPALRNALAQAAIARAQDQWSFSAYVDRLERYYEEAVSKE
jgi:glycosyltransferase involved in cell wall biosynthesis